MMAYSPHVCVRPHMSSYIPSRYPSISRKPVTVEEILVWAYRTELVHVARPENLPVEAVVNDYSPGPVEWRVERVDASRDVGFVAHHDAYRVHEAVLALGTEPLVSPAWQPPATGPEVSRGALPHRDAIRTCSRAQLVMGAALRLPPEACLKPEIEVRRLGTIYDRDRRGVIRRNARGQSIELICMIEFSGDLPWIVAHERFLYREWALALRELREALRELPLQAHAIADELPRPEPWLGS